MWLNLNDSQIATLKKLLPRINRPGRHKASLRSLINKLANAEADLKDPDTARYIAGAKDLHEEEGTCEIDDSAVVSKGMDSGAYVMAWVWVGDEDLEEEDKDGDEEEG